MLVLPTVNKKANSNPEIFGVTPKRAEELVKNFTKILEVISNKITDPKSKMSVGEMNIKIVQHAMNDVKTTDEAFFMTWLAGDVSRSLLNECDIVENDLDEEKMAMATKMMEEFDIEGLMDLIRGELSEIKKSKVEEEERPVKKHRKIEFEAKGTVSPEKAAAIQVLIDEIERLMQ